MNPTLTQLLISSIIASSDAMSSIVCDTCYFKSATIIGQVDIPLPSYEADISSSNSTGDYLTGLPFELRELIATAEELELRDESETSGFGYYASYTDGLTCSFKPSTSFESWEESFSSHQECCEQAFSWDVDACLESTDYLEQLPSELRELIASAEQESTKPTRANESRVKYFASYAEGSLCASKSVSSFESWEDTFESLEECCEVAFSWDMDACLQR